MARRSLLLQQLDRKMEAYAPLKQSAILPGGWVRSIRTAVGMSLAQLGRKLTMTKQGALDIERREQDGTITLKSLQEAARAMDMQLVYGFVPQDGSLDALIERKAIELATKIVLRTSATMQLEDQGNSAARLEAAIRERAEEIKQEMPRYLWD
ncbi:mobile mystery protein A [Candidatus Pollutiaquabacter sp.]|uniref:mobile mystery protein A n=1 Tax=Candidatus Pollutiaquabacter sp. TaxID=3416354 RepID=UPI003CC499E4|nr:mobile mystery protein A [Bacteroidota bacterium]